MSDQLLDVNKIAADVSIQMFTKVSGKFFDGIGKAFDSVKVSLRIGFDGYFAHILRRTAHVKTLIHPDERANISDIYAPLSFKSGRSTISDSDLARKIRRGGKILISGTAGSGKSMFVKNITASMLTNFDEIVPIYFELRLLDANSGGLEESLLNSIKEHVSELSMAMFRTMLERGCIALILDGYDELDYTIRDKCGIDLMRMCERYPKAPVVITSRPEDKLSSLTAVDVYHAQPMTKDQCLALISKFVFDEERLNEFKKEVDGSLYDKHRDFLSNPLLTSMMLLTFSYHSDLPEKIHIFYQQAFETLYQRHDRSKGIYTRKILSQLAIDDFQRILEHFSASTYAEQLFQFDESRAVSLISNSISYNNIVANSNNVLNDLIESTCTIQRDGLYLTYVHRSFQEYFAAKFIANLEDRIAERAIARLVDRALTDSAVFLLAEINRPLFERVWAIPTCERIVKTVRAELDSGNVAAAAALLYTDAMISGPESEPDERGRVGFYLDSEKTLGVECMILWRLYKRGWHPASANVAFDNLMSEVRRDRNVLQLLAGKDRSLVDLQGYFESDDSDIGMMAFPILDLSDGALKLLGIREIVIDQINGFSETLEEMRVRSRRRDSVGLMFE